MKKLKKIISLGVMPIFILLSLFGCTVKKSEYAKIMPPGGNLISHCLNQSGNTVSPVLTGKNGESAFIDLMFAENTRVNTLILQEENDYITLFNIYALNGGEAELIYSQDKIGTYRVCSFPAVWADGLRLEVVSSKSVFSINEINAFNIVNSDKPRVSSYIKAQDAYILDNIDAERLSAIDEFIFYSAAYFDEDGNVILTPVVIDGNETDGGDVLKTAMDNLTKAAGRELAFSAVLSLTDGGENTDDIKRLKANGDICVAAFEKGSLTGNVISFTNEYSLDGVIVDWGYPVSVKHWQKLGVFLNSLKLADQNKNIGVCLGDGDYGLSKDVYSYIDRVVLNAYDIVSDDGYHSDFARASELIEKLHKSGCDYSKIQLGLPFYGKTVDKANTVFGYKNEAYALGRFGNSVSGVISGYVNGEEASVSSSRYYNGYQMIYDKMSYVLYMGLYGAAAFDFSYDLPYYDGLSLFKAMSLALSDKTPLAENQ